MWRHDSSLRALNVSYQAIRIQPRYKMREISGLPEKAQKRSNKIIKSCRNHFSRKYSRNLDIANRLLKLLKLTSKYHQELPGEVKQLLKLEEQKESDSVSAEAEPFEIVDSIRSRLSII